MKGNVGIRVNGKLQVVEAELPPFEARSFSNRFMEFKDPPAGLADGSREDRRFEPQDPRFAYVHTLYHASPMLEDYSSVFRELGLRQPELIRFEIDVQDLPFGKTSARTFMGEGRIRLQGSALFDETAVCHEVGHALHGQLHRDAFRLREARPAEARFTPAENELHATREAIADVFAALHLESPLMEPEQPEPRNLTVAATRSRTKSLRMSFERALADPEFRRSWPANVRFIEKALAGEHPIRAILDCPDPYPLSLTLSGPIWRAAERHGIESVRRLFARTVSADLHASLDAVAHGLLAVCKADGESNLREYLATQFRAAELI